MDMIEEVKARVCLRHLWAACEQLWPTIPARQFRQGRSTSETDKRATFVLACKGFGFTHAQIGNFIKRERSTVLHAECIAMERRDTDSDYGAAVMRIRELARQMAAQEAANIPAPPPPAPPPPRRSPDEAFAADVAAMMRSGSEALLRGYVRYLNRHHPEVVKRSQVAAR